MKRLFTAADRENSMTIEVRNVCKSFKDVDAVLNVNLRVESGEAVALLGPNGAGKTTLVEMIEGVQTPDSGEILILGKTWQSDESFLRQEIGLALQETRFQDRLTVEETLRLFASFYHLEKKRTNEVLKIIQLESKRKNGLSSFQEDNGSGSPWVLQFYPGHESSFSTNLQPALIQTPGVISGKSSKILRQLEPH